MTAPLETLLRQCSLVYGHIQLFREENGLWQADICHYGPERRNVGDGGGGFSDPADALRKALIEDERCVRDIRRRYDIAMAEKPVQIDLEEASAATIDDFEDLL